MGNLAGYSHLPPPPSLAPWSVYCWLHVSPCIFMASSTITPYELFPPVINQAASGQSDSLGTAFPRGLVRTRGIAA